MLNRFIGIRAVVTLERAFQWSDGGRTQTKTNEWVNGEEIQTRTVEKFLEKFDYKWGGEIKEIERDARSKERAFYMEYNFSMFSIFKSI